MADPWSSKPELRLNLCVYILCMVGGIIGNISVILIMIRQKTSRKLHSDTWKTNLFLLSLSVGNIFCREEEKERTAVTLLGIRPAPGDGRRPHPAPPLLLCPGGRDRSLLQDLRIFPSSLLHSGNPQPDGRDAGEVRSDRLPLPLQVPLHPRELQEGGDHRLGALYIPGHPGDLDQGKDLA